MTDRIHSCKESPNGRHAYIQVNDVVMCVLCKRRPDLAREGFTEIPLRDYPPTVVTFTAEEIAASRYPRVLDRLTPEDGADRIHSCKDAPDGRHHWARRRDGRICAYCERREFGPQPTPFPTVDHNDAEQEPSNEAFWQDLGRP